MATRLVATIPSSLSYEFTVSGDKNAEKTIEVQIYEPLHCQYKCYKDRIVFTNAITKDQVSKTEEQHLHYNIKKWKDRSFLALFMTSVKILP